jgi:hypothetical protein
MITGSTVHFKVSRSWFLELGSLLTASPLVLAHLTQLEHLIDVQVNKSIREVHLLFFGESLAKSTELIVLDP